MRSAGCHGVRTPLTETLGEYFHTFRNADALIDGFQTTLLRNWTYFERSGRRSELFGLLAELVLKLLDGPLSDAQFSLLLRQLLMWCAATLNGQHGDEYDAGLRQIGEDLGRLVDRRPIPFLERDGLLRDLVRCAAERPALAPVFFDASTARCFFSSYRRAQERLDVPAWSRAQGAGLTDGAAVAEHFGFLARSRLSALIRRARDASGSGAALRRPPDLLGHPRAGDPPGLQGREPGRPFRGLPLPAERRHPGPPPERGDGRPARRRQTDAAA